MQINYARYPGVVGNDWPGAEQNPAYSSSAKSAPRRIFLVTRAPLFVPCDQLFVTCVFPLSLRAQRSNPDTFTSYPCPVSLSFVIASNAKQSSK